MQALANASGGLSFTPGAAVEFGQAAEAISRYLRESYKLEIQSNLRADGGQHQLAVRVRGDQTQRRGEQAFFAFRNPPKVEMISPRENHRVEPTQRIEFRVETMARVVEAELVVNGKPLTKLTSEPWVYDWDTSGLSGGQNSINIIVRDAAGNQATKVVPIVSPRDNLDRAPLTSMASGEAGGINIDFAPMLSSLLALATLAGAGFATYLVFPHVRRRIPARCVKHGVTFPRGGACPLCVEAARKQINERLGQYSRPIVTPADD